MKVHAMSRFTATLTIAGFMAGAWACGATALVAETPGDDEGDAEQALDGHVTPFPFDSGFGFDGGSPFDNESFESGFGSEGGFGFEGGFGLEGGVGFEGGSFDGDFPPEADLGPDGDFFGSSPPDAGPPWDGGGPTAIATAEQPISLAIDEAHVYWQNSGGTVLDCPLSGCPGNVPTLLAFNGGGYYAIGYDDSSEFIAARSSSAFFITSSDGIAACGSAGCNLTPTTYWADSDDDAGSFDGGGGSVRAVVTDSSSVYFCDSAAIHACPIGSTCSSARTLASGNFGHLALTDTEVFYVDLGEGGAERIRAVPIAGGAPRLVCASSSTLILDAIGPMVVSGGYVYFAPTNSHSIYECPAAGGGTPTVFAGDALGYGGLAADGASVYWAQNLGSGSSIGTCPIGATCIGSRTVASGQDNPRAIAVNSTAVYWTTQTAIYSATK
jgi:hypothetical protein